MRLSLHAACSTARAGITTSQQALPTMGFQRLRSFLAPLLLALAVTTTGMHPASAQDVETSATRHAPLAFQALPSAQQAQLDELEHRTFQFFWDTANPVNGLAPDHWPGQSFSS
ncbi:MAG TPA: hypothetical protein VGN24_09980, partial [Rhodanobacter sp.]|nr:hypothetical protein [Rhodanobacter sp.]